jgi:hypothetical protein
MQFIERAVVVLAASAAASLMLVAAGCGGDSSDPGVADSGGSTSDNPVAFSACMRSHGVPDFPDPKTASGGEILSIPDSDSPRFEAALKSCRKFLPDSGGSSPGQQAQEQAELLKFARCMRRHGVPDFPDPTVSGGRASFPPDGIDRGSPLFAAAKKACAQSLAGVTGG